MIPAATFQDIQAELSPLEGNDGIKILFSVLRKSNPALMEWVRSPIVYQAFQPHADDFRQLAQRFFLPLASCHHSLSMARSYQMKTAKKAEVRLKRYLYTLRPCLCAIRVIVY